ncbi:hypothetical protein ASPACDRAFT_46439 [Aspergillus aculeatus ATCC 16872]|uniref:C2H2-type domain-containing protein n=1 Tax=Aspergillus aculeatus (strain ATCC 16872 / CBS 172.66 / WB 5094) TaxID=690307 RepID=A0A1L9WL81_ASPA1|nr:uncharacterized protein ASPACDRAFT_46439 [Aspergillus aculeatus ATCC 16872]OJJ96912.1 hypothetical protein ASPACDRAFT_46439 [Aspergillus aculeatus ATCC 16872]
MPITVPHKRDSAGFPQSGPSYQQKVVSFRPIPSPAPTWCAVCILSDQALLSHELYFCGTCRAMYHRPCLYALLLQRSHQPSSSAGGTSSAPVALYRCPTCGIEGGQSPTPSAPTASAAPRPFITTPYHYDRTPAGLYVCTYFSTARDGTSRSAICTSARGRTTAHTIIRRMNGRPMQGIRVRVAPTHANAAQAPTVIHGVYFVCFVLPQQLLQLGLLLQSLQQRYRPLPRPQAQPPVIRQRRPRFCPLCAGDFESLVPLVQHLEVDHATEFLICMLCLSWRTDWWRLLLHLDEDHPEWDGLFEDPSAVRPGLLA